VYSGRKYELGNMHAPKAVGLVHRLEKTSLSMRCLEAASPSMAQTRKTYRRTAVCWEAKNFSAKREHSQESGDSTIVNNRFKEVTEDHTSFFFFNSSYPRRCLLLVH